MTATDIDICNPNALATALSELGAPATAFGRGTAASVPYVCFTYKRHVTTVHRKPAGWTWGERVVATTEPAKTAAANLLFAVDNYYLMAAMNCAAIAESARQAPPAGRAPTADAELAAAEAELAAAEAKLEAAREHYKSALERLERQAALVKKI